ncbi:hypothetical protein [Novipirellula rosea]
MTPETIETTSPPPPEKRPPMRWIWLSIAVSSGIIIWAFTIPMRHSHDPHLAAIDGNAPIATVSHHRDPSLDQARRSEQYVARALEMDRKLMKLQRAKDARPPLPSLPGEEEALQHQENYRNWMLAEIERLATAPENSPEWEFRQQLVQSLDAPQ